MRHAMRAQRGRVTTEAAMMYTVIALGFMLLLSYTQRAVQGNLASSAHSIGQAFDINSEADENSNLTTSSTVREQTAAHMVSAPLLEVVPWGGVVKSGLAVNDPNMMFFNSPHGPVPREPAMMQAESVSNWDSGQGATYDVTP